MNYKLILWINKLSYGSLWYNFRIIKQLMLHNIVLKKMVYCGTFCQSCKGKPSWCKLTRAAELQTILVEFNELDSSTTVNEMNRIPLDFTKLISNMYWRISLSCRTLHFQWLKGLRPSTYQFPLSCNMTK